MKIAGPLLQQLAPIAIDALSKVGQEQDLQLGGLLKLGLGLLGGIKQQEDLGFKGGFGGGVSWGAQQDLGFGFNGGFSTPFGGGSAGFGWNQEQQDLFFGLLPSLLGGLMGGAR